MYDTTELKHVHKLNIFKYRLFVAEDRGFD